MAVMTVGGKVGAKALLDQAQKIIKTGKTKDRKTLVDKKKVDQIKIQETKAEIIANEAKIEVKQKDLKLKNKPEVNVDQADATAVGAGANANAGPAVQNPDTEIEVEEDVAKAFLFGQGVSLSDIVDSINAVGATSSDLVAILEALREAGALNAELIVI